MSPPTSDNLARSHPRNIGLIAEDQNRIEIEMVSVKVRQDDRGQARSS